MYGQWYRAEAQAFVQALECKTQSLCAAQSHPKRLKCDVIAGPFSGKRSFGHPSAAMRMPHTWPRIGLVLGSESETRLCIFGAHLPSGRRIYVIAASSPIASQTLAKYELMARERRPFDDNRIAAHCFLLNLPNSITMAEALTWPSPCPSASMHCSSVSLSISAHLWRVLALRSSSSTSLRWHAQRQKLVATFPRLSEQPFAVSHGAGQSVQA